MRMPKFYDRKSLYVGIIAGLVLSASGWVVIDDGRWFIGLFQVVMGLALLMHCLDMVRYYKSHRIVKIGKTDTECLVYKEDAEQNKSVV